MVRKYIYTASIILFAISFGQNKKKLPDNVFANLRFVDAVPQGEFSDNVTNNGYGFDCDIGWYVYNGPVTTTLYPDKSKTDLFNISIGIGF